LERRSVISTSTLVKHPLAVSTWDRQDRAAALKVIASDLTTMGPLVAEFERQFAAYIGTTYAVMVNSGSSANLLMVAAYTLRYGKGTVIVPAVSWATSYSPFQQYGWRLIFVDVDDSLCIDPGEVFRAKQTYRPTAMLAVNLLGNCCDFGRLFEDECPRVLEDNCEALGAEYKGDKAGSFGQMGTHSFFFSHHMSTMEGGMVTTNDRTFYEMLLSLRSHGWTRHLAPDNTLGATVAPFEFIYPGYNVRPMEIQGAIGLAQLQKLPEMIRQRRANAKSCPLPLPREVGQSSWFAFATKKTPELAAKCEIRPVVAGNFTKSQSLKWYDYEIQGSLPMANQIHDEWCYIGNSHHPIDWSAVL
jgi:CDP-4-dehydro-6-deoxyglucose reductase, E1